MKAPSTSPPNIHKNNLCYQTNKNIHPSTPPPLHPPPLHPSTHLQILSPSSSKTLNTRKIIPAMNSLM